MLINIRVDCISPAGLTTFLSYFLHFPRRAALNLLPYKHALF